MPYEIQNWIDISNNFSDSILLGNGASISLSDSFTYRSLRGHAVDNGLLTINVRRLFIYFDTDDFELILRLVWQANKVNEALEIPDPVTREAYEHVRDCLIDSVRSIHPEYYEVEGQFTDIAEFLARFDTVLSLNYDLTLYWVIMYSNRDLNGHYFKDCILHGYFDEDWARFRTSTGRRDQRTSLVFYPHGSLVLARDVVEEETKLGSRVGSDLLRSILRSWTSGSYIPLFVSEGTSQQKISAIQNSHYLNTVYREVIPSLSDSLVIFGWGFGEHDTHILKRIKESSIDRIAVSVFGNDQAYCTRITQMINDNVGHNIEVTFFNCESNGCWNNPA